MVQVPSSQVRSRTPFVNVEITGVGEAIRLMHQKGKEILDGKDAKTLQAANFIQQEVQESIIGNRAEMKSVDTGNFANSIDVNKIQDFVYAIFTDVEYAKFLEYGTSKMLPRYHFRNTLARNRLKIKEIIESK